MSIGYNHPQARKTSRELLRIWNTCWRCGAQSLLSVHHDDRNRMNNEAENMFVICARCHGRIHAKDPLLGKDRFKANLSLWTQEQWQQMAISAPEPEQMPSEQKRSENLEVKKPKAMKKQIDQLNLFMAMTEKEYVQIQAVAKCRIIMDILTRIQADMTEVIDPEEYIQVKKTIAKWTNALNAEIKKIDIEEFDNPKSSPG